MGRRRRAVRFYTYEEGLNLVGGTGEGGDFGAECISVLRYKYTYEEGLNLVGGTGGGGDFGDDASSERWCARARANLDRAIFRGFQGYA